ncbi:MAG TPA: gluconeogenesis factor YvcK family protein [Candidatus Acidoferrales bacterium]
MKKDNHARVKPVRIVALGGGTGLSTLLRGLKQHVARRRQEKTHMPIADLAAVVTVTDDGGSSGRLRREYSILPPGDIRNCMVALSKDEALLGRLFQYRFDTGQGLRGHSFGNLFLTALTRVTGDFPEAVRLSGQVLAIRGRIFPSTAQNVTLEATLEGGTKVAGETRISRSRRRIRRLRLVPRRVRPMPEVLEAIRQADLILVGPGSLYTSILPNLLVEGVAKGLRRSGATRVFISNLMTQPGETGGYTAAEHIRAIYQHTGPDLFDWVVVNRKPISARLLRRYRAQGAEPVGVNVGELQRMGLRCILDDLLEEDGVVRHDAPRLTRLILEEFVHRRR